MYYVQQWKEELRSVPTLLFQEVPSWIQTNPTPGIFCLTSSIRLPNQPVSTTFIETLQLQATVRPHQNT